MSTKQLIAKFETLPPAAQKQVEAFVETLSSQIVAKERKRKRFTFGWAGGLADLKEKFTAVQLQHHLSELR